MDMIDEIRDNLIAAQQNLDRLLRDAVGEERELIQDELDILDGLIDRVETANAERGYT